MQFNLFSIFFCRFLMQISLACISNPPVTYPQGMAPVPVDFRLKIIKVKKLLFGVFLEWRE